jgi:peptide/nickel transport system permease protein
MLVAALLVVLAVLAPVLAPADPLVGEGVNRLQPPSLRHPFGTDHQGRDILSRVIYGTRVSLFVGLTAVSIGATLGIVFGLTAGLLGGRVDDIICRILDVFFGIPDFLLAIALSVVLGFGLTTLITAISIINIPFFARMVRAPTLVEKGKEYIQAARVIGVGTGRMLRRHILPNVLAPMIVQASVSMSYAILIEAGLGFVGLGVQPPTPSWGGMLSEARTYLELAPWASFFPGLAIMTSILAFNLAGDGLRDVLDPTMRGGH